VNQTRESHNTRSTSSCTDSATGNLSRPFKGVIVNLIIKVTFNINDALNNGCPTLFGKVPQSSLWAGLWAARQKSQKVVYLPPKLACNLYRTCVWGGGGRGYGPHNTSRVAGWRPMFNVCNSG
jgi:hypothetical protein